MRAVVIRPFAALVLTLAATAASADGLTLPARLVVDGLDVAPGAAAPSQLQSRIAFGLAAPQPAAGGLPSLVSARLLGDYYFSRPAAADRRASGFRATSGVLIGARLGAWSGLPTASLGGTTFSIERRGPGLVPLPEASSGADTVAVPYLGVGYSDAPAHGRWGFSADLGLMGPDRSAARLGLNGMQGYGDMLRAPRVSPVLQLGISYAF